MDLSDLLGEGKALAIEFSDDAVVNVVYQASALTPRFLRDLAATARRAVDIEAAAKTKKGKANKDAAQVAQLEVANESVEATLRGLAAILVSWDLTSEGAPLGTDLDTLRGLPLSVTQLIWAAIQTDAQGGGEEDDSGNG